MTHKFTFKQLRGALMSGLLMAGGYALVSVLGAHDAFAQATANTSGGIGTVITNAETNISHASNLVYITAYSAGIVALFMGAMKLKAHSENPGQTPMSHGLGRLGVGAALVALPSVAGTIINTMGQSETATLTGGTITGPSQ